MAAAVGWLFLSGMLLVLSVAWWIVMPFYLGSYSKGPKPPTMQERAVALAAGIALSVAWFAICLALYPSN